jgi:5-deoxy-glucuronate isomerase
MANIEDVAHSRDLPTGTPGDLIGFTRDSVSWAWMSFSVRRFLGAWECHHPEEETCCVLLSGRCTTEWASKRAEMGERANVFDGLPYAFYVAPGERVTFQASSLCEIAECHVPSQAHFPSRMITPKDVSVSLRGGGNASRQIVDIMPPAFRADRLIVVEVYTPGGNWSSYPPHKHDVHNPPHEVDLDEIYYFRMNRPGAFAYQRLYRSDGTRDTIVTVHDGDAVLVRDGYHPVVAGPGYDVYYLNFIAGTERSLAITEDPEHSWLRSSWPEMDRRLPLVTLRRHES